MSIMLRICLIAASVFTAALMLQKIRSSRVQIEDAIYWLFFAAVLLVFSIFPKTAYVLSELVGTDAPSNFIFLLVIFLLLMKVFSLSLRISRLETKLKELAQRMALEAMDRESREKAGNQDQAKGEVTERSASWNGRD